jgi:endonuclease/exonuclease/phosphatase family metal-dependent hydrolase
MFRGGPTAAPPTDAAPQEHTVNTGIVDRRWRSVSTLVLTAILALTAAPSLRGQPAPLDAAVDSCRELVDESGSRIAGDTIVKWSLRQEADQRRRLDRQCRTVGPIVIRTEPVDTPTRTVGRSLLVVDWNVHVGGGDIDELIDHLTAGGGNEGAAADYVLLIEEAYRAGGLIPTAIESGARVPRRVSPRRKNHTREDIVSIARRRGLALYYVPSMRNGQGWPYEDRGNAILSTLPLSDLAAIELPIDRQRRVAISATAQGIDARNRPWRLRLVTVHLDAFVGARRLWVFATGWRGSQARTVVEAVDPAEPAVVGADLNTWFAGRRESAYKWFARTWPPPPPPATDAHGRLDYIFFKLPAGWIRDSRRLDRRFGSDHRPIVAMVYIP